MMTVFHRRTNYLVSMQGAGLAGFGLVCALLFCWMAPSAFAVQPDEVLDDPKLEDRARDLSAGLRCLVCQNQSIDDSDAPLARDLRLLVRERLKAGDSDSEVLDYVVGRYGEFVLLKPPFAMHTLALWIAPLVVLLLGVLLARRVIFAGSAGNSGESLANKVGEASTGGATSTRLSAEEKRRLDELLGPDPGKDSP